jgi:hypothetical protein
MNGVLFHDSAFHLTSDAVQQNGPAMKSRLKNASGVALLLTLFGCATSTPIQRYTESKSAFREGVPLMSHDIPDSQLYRVYQRAATGFVTINSLREDLEARAQEFADRQGKTILVLGEQRSSAIPFPGNFPELEIVFALVDKPRESSPTVDPYAKLAELKKLLDQHAITQAEYDREKAKILN